MGFWDLFKGGKQREAKPAPKVTSAAELITVYDERGRELKITKADWLKSVLYPAIRKDWSDADKLYGHIINGLRDDLAEHLLSAAERLVELDDESERSLSRPTRSAPRASSTSKRSTSPLTSPTS